MPVEKEYCECDGNTFGQLHHHERQWISAEVRLEERGGAAASEEKRKDLLLHGLNIYQMNWICKIMTRKTWKTSVKKAISLAS